MRGKQALHDGKHIYECKPKTNKPYFMSRVVKRIIVYKYQTSSLFCTQGHYSGDPEATDRAGETSTMQSQQRRVRGRPQPHPGGGTKGASATERRTRDAHVSVTRESAGTGCTVGGLDETTQSESLFNRSPL